MRGVALLLTHPELPSCKDCQTWLHDENWRPTTRGGEKLARPAGCPTPCWKCPKSDDKKTPSPDAELDERSQQALEFYYRIKGGMPQPNDALVAWYCGRLAWVMDRMDRQQDAMPLLMLTALLGGKAGAKKVGR